MNTVTFWNPYMLCINIAIPSKVYLMLWRKTLKFNVSSFLEHTGHWCIPQSPYLVTTVSQSITLLTVTYLVHCPFSLSPHFSSIFWVSL